MTHRQQRFIAEYLIDHNGAAAARRAGYAAGSARQTAVDLLSNPDIADAIEHGVQGVLNKLGVTHEMLVLGLVSAFEEAKRQRDPQAMIHACVRLGEFCGL